MRMGRFNWGSNGHRVQFEIEGAVEPGWIDLESPITAMAVINGILFVLTEDAKLHTITGSDPRNFRHDVIHEGARVDFQSTVHEEEADVLTDEERAELEDAPERPFRQPFQGDVIPFNAQNDPQSWDAVAIRGQLDVEANRHFRAALARLEDERRARERSVRDAISDAIFSGPSMVQRMRENAPTLPPQTDDRVRVEIERRRQEHRERMAELRRMQADPVMFINQEYLDLFARGSHEPTPQLDPREQERPQSQQTRFGGGSVIRVPIVLENRRSHALLTSIDPGASPAAPASPEAPPASSPAHPAEPGGSSPGTTGSPGAPEPTRAPSPPPG